MRKPILFNFTTIVIHKEETRQIVLLLEAMSGLEFSLIFEQHDNYFHVMFKKDKYIVTKQIHQYILDNI